MRPLYVDPKGSLWASRGLKVFRSYDEGRQWEFVAACPGSLCQKLSRVSRLVERFTRSGVHSLLPLSDDVFLATIRGAILKGEVSRNTMRRVFAVQRGSRPLSFCRVPDGRVFWGEYWVNRRRDAVHIYGTDDEGESWNIVHTFPAGEIRHVHAVQYDSFRHGCWVLTGDTKLESKLLFADCDFRRIDTVFSGNQLFRGVAVIPCQDCIFMGTDIPDAPNFLLRLEPETGRVQKLTAVMGSVLGCTRVAEWLVMSVSAERSLVNMCQHASLLVSREGTCWQELYKRKRDKWQLPYSPCIPRVFSERPYFQHPVFALPQGESRSALFAYGQALQGIDGHLLIWNLQEEMARTQRE